MPYSAITCLSVLPMYGMSAITRLSTLTMYGKAFCCQVHYGHVEVILP